MAFAHSAESYELSRRRRRWAQRGMQGYAAYLCGLDPSAEVGAVVGAEVAAVDSAAGDSAWRAIAIGVATGALTFMVNRFLGRIFK